MGDTSLPKVDGQNAVDGSVVQRGADVVVGNTGDHELYRYERYNLSRYHLKVPNGTYTVLLHFAETYNDPSLDSPITGPGQRVFDVSANDIQLSGVDPWREAGGPRLAATRTVEGVRVTDGRLEIRFIAQRREPMINAFEVARCPPCPPSRRRRSMRQP